MEIIVPIPLLGLLLSLAFIGLLFWILCMVCSEAAEERDLQKKRADFLSQSLSKLREKLRNLADEDFED